MFEQICQGFWNIAFGKLFAVILHKTDRFYCLSQIMLHKLQILLKHFPTRYFGWTFRESFSTFRCLNWEKAKDHPLVSGKLVSVSKKLFSEFWNQRLLITHAGSWKRWFSYTGWKSLRKVWSLRSIINLNSRISTFQGKICKVFSVSNISNDKAETLLMLWR